MNRAIFGYVALCCAVYLVIWCTLYFLTVLLDLFLPINPIILFAVRLLFFVAAYIGGKRVMHMKGVEEYVNGWL